MSLTFISIERERKKEHYTLFTISVLLIPFEFLKETSQTFFFLSTKDMFTGSMSMSVIATKKSQSLRHNRSKNEALISDQLINQLLKFRIDGQTINARNVDELYPGLDRLLMRSLQTGDSRQLFNRLKRNLKPEYLLITGKHIHLSVCSQTQNLLEKLIEMGATLGKTKI